ncbi:MAG: hypothetical protein QXL67_02360 [Candidatus Bathyarchaeia archaeon]
MATIAVFAALWGVLNVTLSPIFFAVFHLPFLCDLIGFSSLIISVWATRKVGAATAVGLLATVVNFVFRPGALHFLGFTAASIVFDGLTWLSGYEKLFERRVLGFTLLILISVVSAAFAGALIGLFFMAPVALAAWGGVMGWAGLHAVGGLIGGAIGSSVSTALRARGVKAR